eukprot:1184597-Prorocentrum_minimum.AAC.1
MSKRLTRRCEAYELRFCTCGPMFASAARQLVCRYTSCHPTTTRRRPGPLSAASGYPGTYTLVSGSPHPASPRQEGRRQGTNHSGSDRIRRKRLRLCRRRPCVCVCVCAGD